MAAATAPVLVSLPGHFSQAEHGGLDRQASPALGHQVVDGNKSGLGGPGNLKCHQYFSSPFRPVTEAQSVTQTGVHPLPRAGPRPLGGLSSGTGSGSRGGRVRACDPLGRPGAEGCVSARRPSSFLLVLGQERALPHPLQGPVCSLSGGDARSAGRSRVQGSA